MKKILLTVVLGIAVVAGAQDAAQPAQGQPAAPQSAAPVIKDPAEYNAYVSAVQQKDANAKISGLEAFLTQYPNSVMKNQALEILMGTYQQANNVKKTMETAAKLVTADTCNVRGLALLAYFDRVLAQGGDPNAKQMLADGKKYGQQGLDCLPKITDPEIAKMKDQMTGIFNAAIGISDLQDKDYTGAVPALRKTVDANPADFSVVYPLALAYLTATPPDDVNGLFFIARAANLVSDPKGKDSIVKFGHNRYVKYHGSEQGWDDLLAQTKTTPLPPAGFTIAAYVPPTPAQQAADLVKTKKPEEMSFAEWELVLSEGSPEDQEKIWSALKGKNLQMAEVQVITAAPTKLQLAASVDDIDQKRADIEVSFPGALPAKMVPKEGDKINFEGTPVSYTPKPFVMVMEKGALLTKAAPPAARKPPVHRKSQ